jgi:hypothetical protein
LWLNFAEAALPDDIPMLGESKKLIQKKRDLFIDKGEGALPEIKKINRRLRELLKESETDFPLTEAQAAGFRANLRDIVLEISSVEQTAVDMMQNAIV